MRVRVERSGSQLIGKSKELGCSASKPVKEELNLPTETVPMTDEVIRYVLVMRDFWKKVLVSLRGGGIRRRLMVWGLSLFGLALTTVVVAGYSYTVVNTFGIAVP